MKHQTPSESPTGASDHKGLVLGISPPPPEHRGTIDDDSDDENDDDGENDEHDGNDENDENDESDEDDDEDDVLDGSSNGERGLWASSSGTIGKLYRVVKKGIWAGHEGAVVGLKSRGEWGVGHPTAWGVQRRGEPAWGCNLVQSDPTGPARSRGRSISI